MINNKPTNNSNYRQGLFIPDNKEKVYKLNEKGGLYYRSSWELTAMKYFDNSSNITLWGAECVEIPYQLKKPDKHGIYKVSNHRYYPDFYYRLKTKEKTREILLEVKPEEQTKPPKIKSKTNLSKKQLESYKWAIEEYNRNMSKWEAALEYCDKKGFEFKILVKSQVDRLLQSQVNQF
jgi:hypothetical protein